MDRGIVERHETGKVWTHSNTTIFQAWLKGAFCELGKGTTLTGKGVNGIDGTRRGLNGLVGVAALTHRVLSSKVQAYYSKLRTQIATPIAMDPARKTDAIVVNRHFDATPVLVRLGQFKERLQAQARYLKLLPPDTDDGYSRWKLVSFAEWKKENPRAITPGLGVLEILAHQGTVTCGGHTHQPEELWRETQEFTFPPQVVAQTDASCTFSALGKAWGPFDLSGLQTLAKDLEEQNGVLLINDVPDNCPAMKRLKRAVSTKVSALPNILYPDGSGCEAHVAHNILVDIMRKNK